MTLPLFVASVFFWLFIRYFVDVDKDGYRRGLIHATIVLILNLIYLDEYNSLVAYITLYYMVVDSVISVVDNIPNYILFLAHHFGVFLAILAFDFSENAAFRNLFPVYVLVGESTNLFQQTWELSGRKNVTLLNFYVPLYSLMRLVATPYLIYKILQMNFGDDEEGVKAGELLVAFVSVIFVYISYDWIKDIYIKHKKDIIIHQAIVRISNHGGKSDNNKSN